MRERRQREDEAPRLKDDVSNLKSLQFELEESQGSGVILASRYKRHIVVAHAPAHFEIVCGDPRCRGGGYDLTWDVLRELRASKTSFAGECGCGGQVGSGDCGRTLHYVAHAEYERAENTGS